MAPLSLSPPCLAVRGPREAGRPRSDPDRRQPRRRRRRRRQEKQQPRPHEERRHRHQRVQHPRHGNAARGQAVVPPAKSAAMGRHAPRAQGEDGVARAPRRLPQLARLPVDLAAHDPRLQAPARVQRHLQHQPGPRRRPPDRQAARRLPAPRRRRREVPPRLGHQRDLLLGVLARRLLQPAVLHHAGHVALHPALPDPVRRRRLRRKPAGPARAPYRPRSRPGHRRDRHAGHPELGHQPLHLPRHDCRRHGPRLAHQRHLREVARHLGPRQGRRRRPPRHPGGESGREEEPGGRGKEGEGQKGAAGNNSARCLG